MTALKDRTTKPGITTHLKGVFFGPPKTGKTTVACSMQKTLLMEFEPDGDITDTISRRKDVDVIQPKNFKETEEIVRALYTTDNNTWRALAVDSVTWMYHVLSGKSILDTLLEDKDPRRAYGKAGAATNYLIHDMVRIPNMHVFFTAQIQATTDKDDEVPMSVEEGKYPLTLAVSPMVYKLLTPAVSFIGRTYKRPFIEQSAGGPGNRKMGFYVSFDDGGRSPAGSRLALPSPVKDLNLDSVLEALTKEE